MTMKYGERLAAARKYNNNKNRTLSQEDLASASGTSQANISALERGNATGSEFTAQFAIACGVNPLWLATGEGNMADARFYIQSNELKSALIAMEDIKPYLKKVAIAEIIDVIERLVEVNNKKSSQ